MNFQTHHFEEEFKLFFASLVFSVGVLTNFQIDDEELFIIKKRRRIYDTKENEKKNHKQTRKDLGAVLSFFFVSEKKKSIKSDKIFKKKLIFYLSI